MKSRIVKLDELSDFAEELITNVKVPFFIGLSGEMGAGKTTFTQVLVNKIFNKDMIVTSPTFSIINIYEDNNIKVVHADLFRLEDYDDLIFSGIEEYLFGNDAIVIAEWYDKINFEYPRPNILINMEIISEFERKFDIIENF